MIYIIIFPSNNVLVDNVPTEDFDFEMHGIPRFRKMGMQDKLFLKGEPLIIKKEKYTYEIYSSDWKLYNKKLKKYHNILFTPKE
jgi:hypothetical protein